MSSENFAEKQVTIHVVYAQPHNQVIKTIQLSNKLTVLDAVKKSNLLEEFPDINTRALLLGVFGKAVTHNAMLEDGMRIEIYRPLIIDPKENRRKRAEQAKKR